LSVADSLVAFQSIRALAPFVLSSYLILLGAHKLPHVTMWCLTIRLPLFYLSMMYVMHLVSLGLILGLGMLMLYYREG
jgi:hypothetical protein